MDIISRFDSSTAQEAHGGTILAGPVLPAGLVSPVADAWGYLSGHGEMEPHTHHKEEVYIFTKGSGYVVVNGTRYPVGPGDVAYIPPDSEQNSLQKICTRDMRIFGMIIALLNRQTWIF